MYVVIMTRDNEVKIIGFVASSFLPPYPAFFLLTSSFLSPAPGEHGLKTREHRSVYCQGLACKMVVMSENSHLSPDVFPAEALATFPFCSHPCCPAR